MKKIISISFVLFFTISLVNANEMNFNVNSDIETNIETVIGNANTEAMMMGGGVLSVADELLQAVFKGIRKIDESSILKLIPDSGIRRVTEENIGEVLVELSKTDKGYKLLRKISWISPFNKQEEVTLLMKTFYDEYNPHFFETGSFHSVFEQALLFSKVQAIVKSKVTPVLKSSTDFLELVAFRDMKEFLTNIGSLHKQLSFNKEYYINISCDTSINLEDLYKLFYDNKKDLANNSHRFFSATEEGYKYGVDNIVVSKIINDTTREITMHIGKKKKFVFF